MNEQLKEVERPIGSGIVGRDLVSAALVAVQGELEPATFDSTNPFLRNRYASLGAVIHSSRPILAKHNLAVLQTPSSDGNMVSVQTSLVHASGQTITCGLMELPIGEEKGKSRAQVAGSIITYLRRYAWASVLGMYADEDTDGNAPQGKGPKTKSDYIPDDDDVPFESAPGRAEPPKPSQGSPPPVKTPPSGSQAPPKPLQAPLATPKHRLKALNNLQAAPGQPNVGLVEGYLRSKMWITGDQTTLDFPLEHVPTNKEEMKALSDAVARFEITQREQVTP